MEALELANQVARTRARQKKALHKAPLALQLRTLLDPPKELATYKLSNLFCHRKSIVPYFGPTRAEDAMLTLSRKGMRAWHTGLRLGELTERERKLLVDEIVRRIPGGERLAA
jgi:hypothetical protein